MNRQRAVEITIRTDKAGWCKPSKGRVYGGEVSLRQFRTWLKNGLKHVQLPNGRILTKYEWIDAYLEQFEVKDSAKEMADELVDGL